MYIKLTYLFILYKKSMNNIFFFFSSRRRHTRCYRDWSSDVCSADLCGLRGPRPRCETGSGSRSRRSEERRVGKSVDLGGRRIIKKKKKKKKKKEKALQKKQTIKITNDKIQNIH